MTERLHIVTVSGPPGSGTSTACEQLSLRLGWYYVNAGQIFRQMAEENGVSLDDFGQRAEKDIRIDRDLDARMVQIARQRQGAILEGRITGWMAVQNGLSAFKVWFQASPEVRASRVGSRDHTEPKPAMRDMLKREKSETKRYRDHYGIDIGDLSVYDLVIDTEDLAPQAVVERIVVAVEAWGGGP